MISRPTWVKCEGRLIKKSAYIITGNDNLHPKFAKILDLLVILDEVIIEVSHCVVIFFDSHYHAYSVVQSDNKSLICFSDLPDKSVLHAHQKSGSTYIYLKYYFHVV